MGISFLYSQSIAEGETHPPHREEEDDHRSIQNGCVCVSVV